MSTRITNIYEKAFRLISVPLLGLVAFACAMNHEGKEPHQIYLADPNLQAADDASRAGVFATDSADAIDLELSSVQETEQINDGRYRPFQTGSTDLIK